MADTLPEFILALRQAADEARELAQDCRDLTWRIFTEYTQPDLREWDDEMHNCYPNWPDQW